MCGSKRDERSVAVLVLPSFSGAEATAVPLRFKAAVLADAATVFMFVVVAAGATVAVACT